MSDHASTPLTGVDIAWLRMDSPTNLMIINAMIITEDMEFKDFRNTIVNRFPKSLNSFLNAPSTSLWRVRMGKRPLLRYFKPC